MSASRQDSFSALLLSDDETPIVKPRKDKNNHPGRRFPLLLLCSALGCARQSSHHHLLTLGPVAAVVRQSRQHALTFKSALLLKINVISLFTELPSHPVLGNRAS